MKIEEEYECDYMPGDTLKVDKVYDGGSMAKLKSTNCGTGHLAKEDPYDGPRLCLAHISKQETQLKKKEATLIW